MEKVSLLKKKNEQAFGIEALAAWEISMCIISISLRKQASSRTLKTFLEQGSSAAFSYNFNRVTSPLEASSLVFAMPHTDLYGNNSSSCQVSSKQAPL